MALGPKASEAARSLKQAANEDEMDDARLYAKIALLHMESKSLPKAVAALNDAFNKLNADEEDEETRTAVMASDGLAFLASESKEALQCLLSGLKDKRPSLRAEAAGALGDIVGSNARHALEPLQKAAKDPDKIVCIEAIVSGALLTQGVPSEPCSSSRSRFVMRIPKYDLHLCGPSMPPLAGTTTELCRG